MASNSNSNIRQRPQAKKTPKAPKRPRVYQESIQTRISKSKAHEPAVKLLGGLKGSARSLKMARSLMLPGLAQPTRPYPALTTAQLCTRTINKNYVIGAANISASGTCAIMMSPNLHGPAYVMKPGVTLYPDAPAPFYINVDAKPGSYALGCFTGLGVFSGSDQSVNAYPEDVTLLGDTRPAWDISNGLASTVDAYCKKLSQHTKVATITFYWAVAGAWTESSRLRIADGMEETRNISLTVPAGAQYFGFRFKDENDNPIKDDHTLRVSLSITYGAPTQTPQATLGGTATALYSHISEYILDSQIESGCINSMAVLCSNTSAALKQQGEIFACRAPPTILHDWGKITDTIVALPSTRFYTGPASQGAYAWWIPDTIESSSPSTIFEYANSIKRQDILFIYMKGLDPDSSFNVSFTWNVSFFTKNQLFEKNLTPPVTQEWQNTYHALSALPAAMCNPEHVEMFKNILRKGVGVAGDLYANYQEHKAIYDALLGILGSFLA